MVLAPGQRIRIIIPARYSYELVDLVVIRSYVFIADGPRYLPTIMLRRFEIEIGIAQAHAAPYIRLAADAPHPDQREGLLSGSEIWLLFHAKEELGRVLAPANPIAPFVRPDVGPKLGAVESRSCVEHQNIDSLASKVPGRHPSGSA